MIDAQSYLQIGGVGSIASILSHFLEWCGICDLHRHQPTASIRVHDLSSTAVALAHQEIIFMGRKSTFPKPSLQKGHTNFYAEVFVEFRIMSKSIIRPRGTITGGYLNSSAFMMMQVRLIEKQ